MNNKIRLDLLERENLLLKMENEKLKADLDYVSMMTDVEIPEEEEYEDGTFSEV